MVKVTKITKIKKKEKEKYTSLSLEQSLDKASVMVLLTAVLSIVLFFDIRLYSTFDISKATLLFYSFIMLVTIWICKCFLTSKITFIRTPLDLPVLLFLSTFFISTIFSIAPYLSFYGCYKRYEGLLAYICYIGFYYMAAYLFFEKERWQRYGLYVIILTVLTASIYGAIQHFGKDPLTWEIFDPYRIISTFGNPVFISVFLIIAFPLTCGLALWGDEKNYLIRENKPVLRGGFAIIIWTLLFILIALVFYFISYGAPTPSGSYHAAISPFFIIATLILFIMAINTRLPFWFFIVIALFTYYCLSYTLTRASFLGFYISSLVFLILLGKKEIFSLKKRILAIGLGCLILFIIFSLNPRTSPINRFLATFAKFSTPSKAEEKEEYKKENDPKYSVHKELEELKLPSPLLKNYLPCIFGKHLTGSAAWRLYIWSTGTAIARDYPLVGIGPDTLGIKFPSYLKRKHPEAEKSGILEMEDRVHNETVDTALGRGLIALSIYFWCMAAFFLFFLGQRRMQDSRFKSGILLCGAIALLAYLIQNQFSFGNTPLSSTIWFLLGTLVAISGKTKRVTLTLPAFTKRWKLPLCVFSISLSLSIMFLLVFPYAADYCYKEATSLSMWNRQGFEPYIINELIRSVKLHPMEPRYQEELMRNYVNFAMDTRFEEEKRRDYLEKATLVAKKLLSLYPENNAAYFTLGMVEHLQNRTDQAVNYYKKGLELQPYVADMHNNLGLAYLSKGDFKKAAKHFLAAVYCNYRHPQFLERFATASLHAFGYKETKKRVKEIIQNFGLYHYPYVYIVLGWLAFQGGDLNLAEACNLEVLKLQEKHLAAHRNLAIIYYRKREYQKAYEYYSKVLDLSPTDREAQHMVRLLSSMLKKR